MANNPLFKEKTVPIQTLAEYLKQIREQLNLDIKTVSLLTQIKPQYLISLEAGKWEELPADVYIRGFLRSLSHAYRIKEQVLIEQYDKEHGFLQIKKPKKTTREKIVTLTPRTLVIGITIVLALSVSGYVISQVSSVLTPPYLEITDPSSDITIPGNSIVLSGSAEVGADVFVNDQAVLTDKNGQFAESLVLSPGINVVEIIARNKFKKESRIVRHISAEVLPGVKPDSSFPVNIVIEIGPNSAWVYMEADGMVVQRGTMLPGSTKSFSAKEEVLLTTANAGSTKVIYNDQDLGQLGREGEVLRNIEFSK
jgi:cytoskeleton protein RodZ